MFVLPAEKEPTSKFVWKSKLTREQSASPAQAASCPAEVRPLSLWAIPRTTRVPQSQKKDENGAEDEERSWTEGRNQEEASFLSLKLLMCEERGSMFSTWFGQMLRKQRWPGHRMDLRVLSQGRRFCSSDETFHQMPSPSNLRTFWAVRANEKICMYLYGWAWDYSIKTITQTGKNNSWLALTVFFSSLYDISETKHLLLSF